MDAWEVKGLPRKIACAWTARNTDARIVTGFARQILWSTGIGRAADGCRTTNSIPQESPAVKAELVTTSPTSPITLDQFLKITGLVGTGGQAKIAIQEGYVMVNGELETRRRRKLALGDVVVVDNEHKFVVTEEMIRRV